MRIRKVLNRKIREQRDGVNIAGDINATIVGNIEEPGVSVSSVSSTNRIVQRTVPNHPKEVKK
jgi:hypothetical protein